MKKIKYQEESLITKLKDYLRQYKKIWLLVDPRIGSYPEILWHELIEPERHYILRDIQDKNSHDAKCLQLYQLLLDDIEILEQSVAIALGSSAYEKNTICGWFFTFRPVEMISKHLINRFNLKDRTMQHSYLFRYYDSRIMEQLVNILSPEQLSNLLSPIDHYFFTDRFNQGVELSHDSQFVLGNEPFTVGIKQRHKIENIKYFNKTLSFYQAIEDEVLPEEKDSLLFSAIDKALSFPMEKTSDIVNYSYHTLIYGKQLIERNDISQLIKNNLINETGLDSIFNANMDAFLKGQ